MQNMTYNNQFLLFCWFSLVFASEISAQCHVSLKQIKHCKLNYTTKPFCNNICDITLDVTSGVALKEKTRRYNAKLRH